MTRGADSVRQFSQAMQQTLNLPKNARKPHWSGMILEQLEEKLAEELGEVLTEIEIIKAGGGAADLIHETVDLANVAMMLREWAIRRIIQERSEM